MKETLLYKKIYGCLVASAIGDQLGRPVENWDYRDIEKQKGRITDPWEKSGSDRWDFDLGTDDTALAQILCRTYIAKGGRITVEDYARQWLKEIDPARFFFCMRNTYELLKKGYSPRITGALNIVTGSGLMAISPVGIYNACDPDAAYAEALELASMYQPELDTLIPGVIAAAIAEAFRPDATVDSVIETALRLAPRHPVVTFDERRFNNLKSTLERAVEIGSRAPDVFSAREGLYEEMLQYAPIDPQEVFALAFGIFAASRGDTKQAIIGGANIGRDADTISSLNGQLCGALNGKDSIPADWRERFEASKSAPAFLDTVRQMTDLVRKRLSDMERQIRELQKLTG